MSILKRAAVALLAATALTAVAAPSIAQEFSGKSAGDFIVRARGLAVIPHESGDVKTAAGVDTGLNAEIKVDHIPEVDFSYFITDNIALELIAGTSKHSVSASGVPVGDVRLLPPTLTAQYHFMPKSRFSPYVGAGVNYTFFFNEDAKGAVINSFDLDNSFGAAVQVGFDYFVTDNILINFDVKKLWLSSDLTARAGTLNLKADVDVNPLIVGVGVGYKF